MAMGQRPLRWAFVSRFVKDLKSLLAGEDIVVDGAVTRMMHPPGFAPQRPIRVPILIAANGPKGIEVARELAEGLIYGGLAASAPKGFSVLQMGLGTVLLDEGESPTSDRVIEAAKQSFAIQYHLAYEGFFNPPIPVEQLPHGADWLHSIEATAPGTRHLQLHDRHMVGLNVHDAAFIKRHPESLAEFAANIAVTPPQLRERLAALAQLGATRISCAVSFANWEDDMERYAKALDLAVSAKT
jgi:5,10-methylenetetrahydromethanopterin reductase